AARAAPAGSALGVDLSDPMLDYARRVAESERLTNCTFLQADAQIHPFEPASFDVAICRTSAMFFADHVAALANIGRALRSGGRLVLLTWQPLAGNEWLEKIATALAAGRPPQVPAPGAGPFALSDPDRIRALLGAAHFVSWRAALIAARRYHRRIRWRGRAWVRRHPHLSRARSALTSIACLAVVANRGIGPPPPSNE